MTKAELRKIYLAKRRQLTPDETKEKSRSAIERLFRSFNLSKIKFLHCFLPIEKFNEVDTRLIFERVWREFPQIVTVVPRVNFETEEIENLKFNRETQLSQNLWEIHEPAHDEKIESEKIDMILIPLLCFDSLGHRVGYGKGFYDRFLNHCRPDAPKVGVSFFSPVEQISDANEFDAKLDFCVTPDEIFAFDS